MKLLKKYFKLFCLLSIVGIICIASVNYFIKDQTNDLIIEDLNQIPNTKVAIIFGAGINGNTPSSYLQDRLDAGILLYKTQKVKKLLLSGDNGNDAHDELTVMKNYCFEKGVDTTKIYLDYAGFDTYSTMYRAKKIFDLDSAILVSQKYHLNRAIYLGSKMGVKSIGFVANKREYTNYLYVQFREFFSVFKSTIDVLRNRKPRFLGEKVSIDGVSNYTKPEKITNSNK
jgi:SanA protein